MFPLEHINFSQTFDTPYTYIIYDIVYKTTYKQTVTNTQHQVTFQSKLENALIMTYPNPTWLRAILMLFVFVGMAGWALHAGKYQYI